MIISAFAALTLLKLALVCELGLPVRGRGVR